jgi:hypothetical protein
MPYVTVDVEVELDEFSDEELIAELRGRTSYDRSIREIYDLLHMGKDEQALAAMKTFICNETGRIL